MDLFFLLPAGTKFEVALLEPDLQRTIGTQNRKVYGWPFLLAPPQEGVKGNKRTLRAGRCQTDFCGCSTVVLLMRSEGLVMKMSPLLHSTGSLTEEYTEYGIYAKWVGSITIWTRNGLITHYTKEFVRGNTNLLSTRNFVQISWISLQSTGYGMGVNL